MGNMDQEASQVILVLVECLDPGGTPALPDKLVSVA